MKLFIALATSAPAQNCGWSLEHVPSLHTTSPPPHLGSNWPSGVLKRATSNKPQFSQDMGSAQYSHGISRLTYSLSNSKVSIVWRVRTCPGQEVGRGWHTLQSVCFLCWQIRATLPYVSSISDSCVAHPCLWHCHLYHAEGQTGQTSSGNVGTSRLGWDAMQTVSFPSLRQPMTDQN